MTRDDRRRWDQKYGGAELPESLVADAWLVEAVAEHVPGRALVLACGLGENAVWLATRGWQVDAVDVSVTGLQLASRLAARHNATIRFLAGDLDLFSPLPSIYDLVIVFRFLERERLPGLITRALAPGGLLVYETFGPGQCERTDNHLGNPDFALVAGELPVLFNQLEVLRSEDAVLEDRSVGRLIARRD